jgi:hypothetical protein
MVTAILAGGQTGADTAGKVAFGVIEIIAFVGYGLLFAVLLVYMAVLYASRGAAARRRRAAPRVVPRAGKAPPGLDALRAADPTFDEQLLLDAALTTTLLVFVAMSSGDISPLARLVTDSFWSTPFGEVTRMTARDRRRERAERAKSASGGGSTRAQWAVPLDYHPSVPELTAIELGHHGQQVTVRVSFGQLQAVIRPNAEQFASAATASSLSSGMVAMGRSVGSQLNDGHSKSVSWMSASGHYDLTFVRPPNARTDPSAALADRTCTTCGATYRSELAIACQHCQAPRALPWGNWRLAQAMPVQ